MALFRALETVRSSGKRLFSDPYAVLFLDNGYKRAVRWARFPFGRKFIQRKIHKRMPGGFSSGVARTKYIDDLLHRSVREGVQQVIILGAGFDMRSLRLDFLQQLPVIEIDHPNTAKLKLGTLQSQLGRLPANVRYYQLDLNEQSLDQLAVSRSLDFSLPTAFIWEGVTNYLTPQAIDQTFAFVQQFAKGSAIIFTYIDRLILEDPASFYGGDKLLNDLAEIGEPWTFGFDPETLGEYLARFDLTLVEDLSAIQYRDRYIPEWQERGYEFYRTAYAVKLLGPLEG